MDGGARARIREQKRVGVEGQGSRLGHVELGVPSVETHADSSLSQHCASSGASATVPALKEFSLVGQSDPNTTKCYRRMAA